MKLKHQIVEQLPKEEKQKALSCLRYVLFLKKKKIHLQMCIATFMWLSEHIHISVRIILCATTGPKKA